MDAVRAGHPLPEPVPPGTALSPHPPDRQCPHSVLAADPDLTLSTLPRRGNITRSRADDHSHTEYPYLDGVRLDHSRADNPTDQGGYRVERQTQCATVGIRTRYPSAPVSRLPPQRPTPASEPWRSTITPIKAS